MKKIKVSFDTWIHLLGMIGVLGGLVFVGLEMRQSQQIAIGTQQMARATMNTDAINALMESGLNVQTVLDMLEGNTPITEEYQLGIDSMIHHAWWVAESDFVQNEMGLMQSGTWQAKSATMESLYNNCYAREAFDSRKFEFHPGLVALVESYPDECTE